MLKGLFADFNFNGIHICLQASRKLIVELIVIGVERSNVVGNGSLQLVMDVLTHLGICLIRPFATRLVIPDLLHDRGNASLLGNRYAGIAYNSKNRRSTSALLVVLGRLANAGVIGQEEVIARVGSIVSILRLKSGARFKRIARRRDLVLNNLGNFIENAVFVDTCRLGGTKHILGQPVGDILRTGTILQRVVINGFDNGLLGVRAYAVGPLDVGDDLISRPRLSRIHNIGFKDLVCLESGGPVVLILRDGNAVVRSRRTFSRKRHGHRGHYAAEAQRRRDRQGRRPLLRRAGDRGRARRR